MEEAMEEAEFAVNWAGGEKARENEPNQQNWGSQY